MPDEPATLLVEGEEMPDVEHAHADVCGDLDQDSFEIRVQSMTETQEQLMAEIAANGEQADNVVRLSAARKFNEVDPIQAAANDVVGRIDPNK